MAKILFLVVEDGFFASHCKPMAQAARGAGLEVLVATKMGDAQQRLAREGYRFIPLNVRRNSFSPLNALMYIVRAYRIMRREKPDIVHCISLNVCVLGGIAALLARVRNIVLAPTGLGFLWINNSLLTIVARNITRYILGSLLRRPKTQYLFENKEDPIEFGLQPDDKDVTIVGGAGVEPDEFPVTPECPTPPVKIAVVCRMIEAKGIRDAIEATRRARARGALIELHLIGEPDPSARNYIPERVLQKWNSEPAIHWHGYVADVASVWKRHHVALLLTRYREGLPRSLVEAAAAGRPIVTTDAVGCREFVRDGKEGFLVAPGDVEAAARVLLELSKNRDLRIRVGNAAHEHFLSRFTAAHVRHTIGDLYRSKLNFGGAG